MACVRGGGVPCTPASNTPPPAPDTSCQSKNSDIIFDMSHDIVNSDVHNINV